MVIINSPYSIFVTCKPHVGTYRPHARFLDENLKERALINETDCLAEQFSNVNKTVHNWF